MNAVTALTLGIIGVSAVLCIVRVLLGKTLADRVVALDSTLIMIGAGIAVYTVRIGSNVYLRLLFVTALMGFVGTVAVARFIEGKESSKNAGNQRGNVRSSSAANRQGEPAPDSRPMREAGPRRKP